MNNAFFLYIFFRFENKKNEFPACLLVFHQNGLVFFPSNIAPFSVDFIFRDLFFPENNLVDSILSKSFDISVFPPYGFQSSYYLKRHIYADNTTAHILHIIFRLVETRKYSLIFLFYLIFVRRFFSVPGHLFKICKMINRIVLYFHVNR